MKILWFVSCILFGIGIVACGSAPFTASPQIKFQEEKT